MKIADLDVSKNEQELAQLIKDKVYSMEPKTKK